MKKTFKHCLFFMYISFGEEKNKMKFTASAALIIVHISCSSVALWS